MELKKIGGLFNEIIQQKNNQGRNALADDCTVDYRLQMLLALAEIENANPEHKEELKELSKFIRNKLWNDSENSNTRALFYIVREINNAFSFVADIVGFSLVYGIDGIIEYISLLAKYKTIYFADAEIYIFEEIIDKVIEIDSGRIIRKQWDDVLGSSDGMECFLRVFDDIFSSAIEKYRHKFLVHLDETNRLSRCVIENQCNELRFIPWPNNSYNRWNPPGKTYLYLSFKNQEIQGTPEGITGGQYICLLECRVAHNTDVCFCDFCVKSNGPILDLSYNDTSLYTFRKMLLDEENRVVKGSIGRLLLDEDVFLHRDDAEYIRSKIIKDIEEHPFSKKLISESVAKQYLKCICSCIYEKVDESNAEQKEKAYKSFHILAEYLESKGIAGIVYPCTRTIGMMGKNLVLFNIKDAAPIAGTVKQYHYD